METKNYSRFVVCSMIWTTVAYSVLAIAVSVVLTPGPMGSVFGALMVVIGFGLLVAIPLGLVTWIVGLPVLRVIFEITNGAWPKVSVEIAGATVALVPFLIVVVFTAGDFDMFGSSALSLWSLLLTGVVVEATMARLILRPRATSGTQS